MVKLLLNLIWKVLKRWAMIDVEKFKGVQSEILFANKKNQPSVGDILRPAMQCQCHFM